MLGDERVDRRHAGDVDDRQFGAGVDDALQQGLHHQLRASAVQRADHRHRQHAVPQLDDGGRQLEQLVLLALDDVLARALVHLQRELRHLVDQAGHRPQRGHQHRRLVGQVLLQAREQRALERQQEVAGLAGRRALRRARSRERLQHAAQALPGHALERADVAFRAQAFEHGTRDLARLVDDRVRRLRGPGRPGRTRNLGQPFADNGLRIGEHFGDRNVFWFHQCPVEGVAQTRRGVGVDRCRAADASPTGASACRCGARPRRSLPWRDGAAAFGHAAMPCVCTEVCGDRVALYVRQRT